MQQLVPADLVALRIDGRYFRKRMPDRRLEQGIIQTCGACTRCAPCWNLSKRGGARVGAPRDMVLRYAGQSYPSIKGESANVVLSSLPILNVSIKEFD